MRYYRHAAALAFVGWYLMVPPTNFPSSDQPLANSPLPQWEIWRSFESAGECERFKSSEEKRMWARVSRARPNTNAQGFARTLHLAMIDAHCIATNDPRLQGNERGRDLNSEQTSQE